MEVVVEVPAVLAREEVEHSSPPVAKPITPTIGRTGNDDAVVHADDPVPHPEHPRHRACTFG